MKRLDPRIGVHFSIPIASQQQGRSALRTIPMTLVLAALLWTAAASPSLGATYTTLDDPLATIGGSANGISGNNIVGKYNDATGGHDFLYDGTTFTTLDFPGGITTVANGIDGNNIVGSYNDGLKTQGFLYDGTTCTTLAYPLATGATIAYGIDGNNIVGSYSGVTGGHGFFGNRA